MGMAPGTALARRGDIRVPFHRHHAEPVMEALFPGSRQRDFGEQDQDLPPGIKAALHRIEIDFGLSRPGHPVEKEGGEPLAKTRRDLGCRGLLVLGQVGTGAGAGRRRGGFITDKDRLQRAGSLHAGDDAGADTGLALNFCGSHRACHAENLRHPLPRRGELFALGKMLRTAEQLSLRRRLQGLRLAERHFRHTADRRHRPCRHPFQEINKARFQLWQCGHLADSLQCLRRHVPLARPQNDAVKLARPERYADNGAARQRAVTCRVVVEGAVERHRDGDPHRRYGCFAVGCRVHGLSCSAG